MDELMIDNEALEFQPSNTWAPLSFEEATEPLDLDLYVHIPFCETRCHFCDFVVLAGNAASEDRIEMYLTGLRNEFGFLARRLGDNIRLRSIQIGGGTPSVLTPEQIKMLFDDINTNFDVSGVEDIIFEGFPNSLTEDRIEVLTTLPNLKINMGVQSFNNAQLSAVGRTHTGSQAIDAIRRIRKSHRGSVGIDIIAGLPGSNPESVLRDLERAIELGVDHVAIYPLWLYPGTKLYRDTRQPEFDSYETRRKALVIADSYLTDHGFLRYTIFHYARLPGLQQHLYGKHQMEGGEWIGTGLGSVSFFNRTVWRNGSSFKRYLSNALSGHSVVETGYRMSARETITRAFAYILRRVPIPMDLFESRFGVPADLLFSDQLQKLCDVGWVVNNSGEIFLTADGILHLGAIEKELVGSIRKEML